MMKNSNIKSLTPLAITFFISGLWDTIAGILYLFVIGTGRTISDPPTHPFYSIFLASFFFCFAYLQFMSAIKIKNHLFVVGSLIFGRLFYVILLYFFIFFVKDFPRTFWFTGIIDGLFVILYIIFACRGKLNFRDLFFPKTKREVS